MSHSYTPARRGPSYRTRQALLAVFALAVVVLVCGFFALFGIPFAGDAFFYGGGFLVAYGLVYTLTAPVRWRGPLAAAILLLWLVVALLDLAVGSSLLPLYEGSRFGLGLVLGTLFAALQRLLLDAPRSPARSSGRWEPDSRRSLPLGLFRVLCSALALVLAAAVVLFAYLLGRVG